MKNAQGYTLIELVMVIVLTGILATFFVQFFALGTDIFSLVVDSQDANQNKRVAVERMAREIRHADSLNITGLTDINITVDVDDDGDTELVRYFVSGGDLHKTVDGASATVVLENVTVSFTGSASRVVVAIDIVHGSGYTSRIRTGLLRRRSMS